MAMTMTIQFCPCQALLSSKFLNFRVFGKEILDRRGRRKEDCEGLAGDRRRAVEQEAWDEPASNLSLMSLNQRWMSETRRDIVKDH